MTDSTMAETTTGVAIPPRMSAPRATKQAGAAPRVKILLEDNAEIPPTGLYVGHNGIGYMLKTGEPMEVPAGVVEILENAVGSLPVLDSSTGQVVGYRDRMRYPFRRL